MSINKSIKFLALAVMISVIAIVNAYTVDVSYEPSMGDYLVDESGMTLYYFENDRPGMSTCYGTCFINWPPFYVVFAEVPEDLDANDFGTITREDGELQTTFRNWPLYYYSEDLDAGDIKGDGKDSLWFVVDPTSFPPQLRT